MPVFNKYIKKVEIGCDLDKAAASGWGPIFALHAPPFDFCSGKYFMIK